MNAKKKIVTDMDMKRLTTVLDDEAIDLEASANLEDVLATLTVVDATRVPSDLVTMNSMVRGEVLDGDFVIRPKIRTITLVYPRSADISDGRISIATPLGIRLLGARQGDEVSWCGPDGRQRKMLISEVVYQPEACGDWHL